MLITPQILLNAYCQGIFPMADPDAGGQLHWYDPNPRTIIPLEAFHISRSLKRRLRQARFEVRFDEQFRQVMEHCAEPAPGREKTWLSHELIDLYCDLHEQGFAHSVETYLAGELVGGVYGVSICSFFAGESMFSRATDASKVALVFLLRQLQQGGYQLFDVQFMTQHLRRFGAIEISRMEYKRRLAQALTKDAQWQKLN